MRERILKEPAAAVSAAVSTSAAAASASGISLSPLNLHSDDDTFTPKSPTELQQRMKKSRSMSPLRRTTETNKVDVSQQSGHKCINQYIILKTIGKGSFAKVKLAEDSSNGELVAIKVMNKALLKRRKTFSARGYTDQLETVKREIAIMKKLHHEHIVGLKEVMDDPNKDKIYLVLDYCEKGSLMDGSPKCDPLPLDRCRSYFRDIIEGLEYLHFQNVSHRDIKPENLLLTKDDRVKIGDFGASLLFESGDDRIRTSAGSAAFMAPEMCTPDFGPFSAISADIWATGVTLFFFVFGECPIQAPTVALIYEKICKQPVLFPHDLPEDLSDLLRRMLEKDPDKRTDIAAIKEHRWVTENGTNPMPPLKLSHHVHISSEDVANAFTLVENVVMVVCESVHLHGRCLTICQIRLKGRMRRLRKKLDVRRRKSNFPGPKE